jgi:MSHA biogenesis protein MshJ
MNARWARLARRIDGLSLRERVILFVSLAVVAAALADSLVLSPQMAVQRQLTRRVQAGNDELAALRLRVLQAEARRHSDTPQHRLRDQIDEIEVQRKAVDAEIQQRLASGDPGTRLPELLAQVLQRHAGLSLLRLESAAPAASGSDTATPPRGVVLQVAGRYADLATFLAEIESRMPGLHWGVMHIDGSTPTPVMSLQLRLPGDAQ